MYIQLHALHDVTDTIKGIVKKVLPKDQQVLLQTLPWGNVHQTNTSGLTARLSV